MIASFKQDISYGLRLLLKDKSFTVIALITLVLCIGANTAIFSVVENILLRPLPYEDSDRIVTLYNLYPKAVAGDRGSTSGPDFAERRALKDVFEELASYQGRNLNLGLEGAPERLSGLAFTPSMFSVLRVKAHRGRTFLEEEAQLGQEKKVMLCYSLWRDTYNKDESILGKDIRINGEPFTVVGILPESFRFGNRDREAKLVIPLAFRPDQLGTDSRHSNQFQQLARLKDGVSVEQARDAVGRLNAANTEAFPQYRDVLINAGFHTVVRPWQDDIVRDIRPALWMLQGGVLLVLIIGCVNIANLLLSRTNTRMKELSVRNAIGAGKFRISQQLVTESVLLGIMGGGLGLLAGAWGLTAMNALGLSQLPRGGEIGMNDSVLLLNVGIALVCGLGFGILPVINLCRENLNEFLRDDSRTGTAGRRSNWIRSSLVVLQVTLACGLLCGAGLLVYSFMKVLRADVGFKSENVITTSFSMPRSRYKESDQRIQFVQNALERVRAIPGVEVVGATDVLPMSGSNTSNVHTYEGQQLLKDENPPVPHSSTVDYNFFQALGIPLIQGRQFEPTDVKDSQQVVVVDQTFAKRWFPGKNPLGIRLRQGVPGFDDLAENPKPVIFYSIIGVVGDIKRLDPAENDPDGNVYYVLPQDQELTSTWTLTLKLNGIKAESVMASIRDEFQKLDPEMPLFETRTMADRLSEAMIERRAPMLLLILFSCVALLLAAVGIYGLLAYTVSQRVREIGIRMALGASRHEVLKMILRYGLTLAAIGLAIGLGMAAAFSHFVQSQLYQISALDFRIYLLVGGTLGLVALLACLIPALRATRIDPNVALRCQ
ncbi:MAG: ABC transporter permease [Verrucomicrobiota bacterium]|nr:ABC transporter permease [Verrucomicrobiota bacterium]